MTHFVKESRKKDISFWLFPFLAYKLIPTSIVNLRLGNIIQRRANTSTSQMKRKLAIVFPLWYLWSKYNPWVKSYNFEKGRLLGFYYMVYGDRIFYENTLLPRWWTESYVNFKIRRRFKRKLKGKEYDFNLKFIDNEVGTDFVVMDQEEGEEDDEDEDEDED